MSEFNANRAFITVNSIKYTSCAILIMACMLCSSGISHAQDTVTKKNIPEKPHSIKKAALFSTALPGLGQIYNRKAWKVPIIYAGFGVLGYFIFTNNSEYQIYKEAYIYTANGETGEIDNPYVGKYTQDQLQRGMDFYRRNRDLSIIITSLWYVLNIMEAYVDAHFFDYDVSEDLSMKIGPAFTPTRNIGNHIAPGLKLTLNF